MIDIASMIQTAASESKYIKMLVYGDPGVGKTTFAAKAPRPLIISHERGTVSLVEDPFLRDTKTIRLKNPEDYNAFFTWITGKGKGQFDTLVIDTVSELQAIFMDTIIKKSADPTSMEIPEGGYNKGNNILRNFLSNLLELDMHIIVLAHVKVFEADKFVTKTFSVTPAVREMFERLMDCIGYMDKKTDPISKVVTRSIQLVETPTTFAKKRIKLPDLIVDPTPQVFIDHLNRVNAITPASPLEKDVPVEVVAPATAPVVNKPAATSPTTINLNI